MLSMNVTPAGTPKYTPATTPKCDEANSEAFFPTSTVKYPPGQHKENDDASEKKL